jgi:small conductance mechanosensitive channel
MQVKFWVEVGFDFVKLRSEAIVKISDRLARERISLVTPTNISITQNAAANEPDKA